MSEDEAKREGDGIAVDAAGCCLIELFGALTAFVAVAFPAWLALH